MCFNGVGIYMIIDCSTFTAPLQHIYSIIAAHFSTRTFQHNYSTFKHILFSHPIIIYCTIAPYSKHNCSTYTAPLQHIYSTIAAHLQHHCSTFKTPLQHIYSTVAAHVLYNYSTFDTIWQHICYNFVALWCLHCWLHYWSSFIVLWLLLSPNLDVFDLVHYLCREGGS